jgi:NCS1 family nucleobase:cation symporter-1
LELKLPIELNQQTKSTTTTEITKLTSTQLWNPDLAPIPMSKRTWGTYNYAALWITFTVNIATYLVASAMIAGGMSWKQAMFTIILGHAIILVPILLNAHAGAKYGIPFPIYSRASFGLVGANVPAVLRALVACGWFGIQTWIGGQAINRLISAFYPHWANFAYGSAICFIGFWTLNLVVVLHGMPLIRTLQALSAPFLIAISLALLGWVYLKVHGLQPVLAVPSRFHTKSEFYVFFVPSLTGVVAHWAAVALNISDFTRYAKSQRAHMWGQALSLPLAMALYSFIAIVVTSATILLFGKPIWDPVTVLTHLGNRAAVILALAALLIATLNVNVAANLVAPANDFSNLWPSKISFKTGAVITCIIGLLMQPWKLLATNGNFLIGWLVGYSSFLGPVAGVLIADYFVVRHTKLDLAALYERGCAYEYYKGINPRAISALIAGIAGALIGLLVGPLDSEGHGIMVRSAAHFLRASFHYAWFLGFALSFFFYLLLMRQRKTSQLDYKKPIG